MSKTFKTFIIGVAGGSGSGKSTAVDNIAHLLKDHKYTLLSHDSYYKDQSHIPKEDKPKTNYDHPSSLETDLMVKHITDLKNGKTIEKPIYSFEKHNRFNDTITVEPTEIILVDGILLMENKALRDLFDLKIFVDTPGDVRFIRRLKRDIEDRGRTVDSVIEQYLATVRPMHRDFVEPSKRYADIIIPEGGKNWVALDLIFSKVKDHLLEL